MSFAISVRRGVTKAQATLACSAAFYLCAACAQVPVEVERGDAPVVGVAVEHDESWYYQSVKISSFPDDVSEVFSAYVFMGEHNIVFGFLEPKSKQQPYLMFYDNVGGIAMLRSDFSPDVNMDAFLAMSYMVDQRMKGGIPPSGLYALDFVDGEEFVAFLSYDMLDEIDFSSMFFHYPAHYPSEGFGLNSDI